MDFPKKVLLDELLKCELRQGNNPLKSSAHFFYERRSRPPERLSNVHWLGIVPLRISPSPNRFFFLGGGAGCPGRAEAPPKPPRPCITVAVVLKRTLAVHLGALGFSAKFASGP